MNKKMTLKSQALFLLLLDQKQHIEDTSPNLDQDYWCLVKSQISCSDKPGQKIAGYVLENMLAERFLY